MQALARWLFPIAILGSATVSAADPLPRFEPKEPAEALKSFVVRDGFEMQLLAAEPLVTDPVAMEYDENGRAYVAEMRDYPYTDKASDKPFVERTKDEPLGRIRLLEDTDGDGRFDKSTIFAEGLSWPTGLALWNGGVYVVATPDLWYLKDTDGDGKADERRKVLTGFRKFNVQAVINNLKWGLDGKIYGAGSSNGGQIRRGDAPDSKPIVMTTADFRFDPRDEAGSFEVLSGGARFGNSFDDWGNRFICNIRNPIQHVVLPRHYLARNPHWPARSALHDVAEAGDTIPVYRRSPPEPWRVMNARRLTNDATIASPRSESVAAGYMTSACGLTVYRGLAYPREFYGTIFLGEVAGNLIHHQVLQPKGVTFTSQRSVGRVSNVPGQELGKDGHVENVPHEFVASTDNWFRPVNFVNAPDGTLHVLDMYRETIEHPWSIPDDIKAQVDLESGRDRGRIYRLAPVGFKPPKPPKLGNATIEELNALLRHPDSWWRETAHRLLLERQDPSAVMLLRGDLLCPDRFPRPEQLHALQLLSSMRGLENSDLRSALSRVISTPGLREHAVLLAEPRLAAQPALLELVLKNAQDDSARVRLQVAFTLGAVTRRSDGSADEAVVAALATIAQRDIADEFIRTAVLSSAAEIAPELLGKLVESERFAQDLSFIVGARGKADELEQLFVVVRDLPENQRVISFVALGLGDGIKRSGKSLSAVLAASPHAGAARLRQALQAALTTMADSKAEPSVRQQAVPLLAFVEFPQARDALSPLLQTPQPAAVQAQAVRVLAGHRQGEVPALLLANYRMLAPEARGETVEALVSRPEWQSALLDAIDAKTVAVFDVPHIRRNLLVRSANVAVKERSVKLFESALTARKQVVDKYREALPALKSDRVKGEVVFRRECKTCHRVGEVGQDIGPNMATIRHRAPEEVLLHILDPNREVGPNYIAYVIITNDGRVLTGLIVEETAHSITLCRATGERETILRSNIEEFAATGQSLMPVGFEDRIPPQEMADLLAFLLMLK